jgi:hypothetical protein
MKPAPRWSAILLLTLLVPERCQDPEEVARWTGAPIPVQFRPVECRDTVGAAESWSTGPEGGTLPLRGHRLEVPKGALQGNVELKLRRHISDHRILSLAPAGTQFNEPVTLYLDLRECGLLDTGPKAVTRHTKRGGWEPPQPTPRAQGDTIIIIAPIDGFSSYALVAP